MAEPSPPQVTCPDCGTVYKWRAEFVGRELHCRCGCVFNPLAMNDEDTAPPPETIFGQYAAAMGAPSPIQQALEARQFSAKLPKWREVVLPSVLLAVGLPAQVLLAWLITPIWFNAWWAFLAVIAGLWTIQAVILLPLMLMMLAAVAKWLDIELGLLLPVTYKAASVVMGVGGVADILFVGMMIFFEFSYFGLAPGLGFYILTCAVPLALLYGMGVYATAIVLIINYLPRLLIVYAIGVLWMHLFP